MADTAEAQSLSFSQLWELGYKNLVPIIPPTAPISEKSSLFKRVGTRQDARGKTPGVMGRNGKWFGFDWLPHICDEADLKRWQAMGAGTGIKTGLQQDGNSLALIDADTLVEDFAAIIKDEVQIRFGDKLPIRVGNYPKAGYLIRIRGDYQYSRIEFGPRDERGNCERVEVLTGGRQFVAGGIHPKTRKPYHWPVPLVNLDSLPIVEPEDMDAFLEALTKRLPQAAPNIIREGAVTDINQETLKGDLDTVRKAVQAIPNTSEHFPSRESYRDMGYAIKAALPDHPDEAFEIFAEWCDRWADDTNDPAVYEADWRRMKGPYRRGAPFLYEKAEALSDGQFRRAEVWFSPVPSETNVFEQRAAIERDSENAPNRLKVITPSPFVLRAPSAIPPRQWLYGGHIIRGFQSLTVAPGGLGKSSLMTVEKLAMVTGKPLLGDAPPEPLRVWSWNGEDPQDELDRRLTAACLHFGITAEDIGGRLMVDSGRSLPIKLATMGNTGVQVATPLVAGLVDALRVARVDVLVIDPFVTTHEVSENDTAAINTVAALWRQVADDAGCAVELVHHMNKAAALDTDAAGIYGSRGAVALIDASRSARYLSRMKKDEADRLGLEDNSRFFRVENGKANMAPMGSAVWRQMIGVPLHNGAGHWPKGDVVGVCTAWTPPEALDGITNADVAAVVEAIRSRPEPPRWEEKANDWVGFLIAEILHLDVGKGLTKEQRSTGQNTARAKMRRLQQEWRQQGVLATTTWRDTRKGRDVEGVTVGTGAISTEDGVFG